MSALDDRLAAADPLAGRTLAPLPATVAAAGAAAISAEPRPAPRAPRSRRRALAVAVALVVAVPASAAAVELAGIHTGVFPGRGDTESVAGEEYLDTGAPAIRSVAVELTRDLPLPAGARWEPFLARWPAPDGGLMQRSGLGMMAEAYARCRWEEAWLRAGGHRDAPAAAAAAAVLGRAAHWRFTVATDGGGVVAAHERVARAAASGRPGPVRADHAANC